jgi:hypothetical protein
VGGRVVRPPQAAVSKGQQNKKIKIFHFLLASNSKLLSQKMEIYKKHFFSVQNFC